MKYTITILLFVFAASLCNAQNITLEECQRAARDNYPLISQKGLIDKLADYNVSNARRNWLPQITLSAAAGYLSEVPTIPDKLAGLLPQLNMNIGDFPHDLYGASVGVKQIVWDGGMVKAQVEASKAEAEVSRQSWETEMYALCGRVNQLYFGVLLLQENLNVADLFIDELNRNYKTVEAMAKYGTADKNDLDKIKVEILGANQQRAQIEASRKAYLQMLGIITGGTVNVSSELTKPAMAKIPATDEINRPEIAVIDARQNLLNAQRKAVNSSVMPQIGAFIQGVYSKPSPDIIGSMMNNKWSPYFMAGISLQWKIGNFYTLKNKRTQIDLSAAMLASQRETILYDIMLQSTQEKAAIDKMTEVLSYDDGIIEIRNDIRRRTETLVGNGEGSVNDLLRELNAEDIARRNKAAHEIEWLKNIYDLKYTVNE